VQLENKGAAVTGSSLGIGRAIALAFGREDASVAINYRRIIDVSSVHEDLPMPTNSP
jgi:NAD(P)-dependent dehydrogenase (short-subunit alcohol dehydrogenase family)